MKAIELRAALIAANDMNLNGADALVETAILKQLIESCKARIEEVEDEAKTMAEAELSALGAKKGKFEHGGHHFTLDREAVYDLIGKPQKYTMPEAVTYRQKAKEQKALKDQSAVLTKEMKAIYDAFLITHPKIEADEMKRTLKCLN